MTPEPGSLEPYDGWESYGVETAVANPDTTILFMPERDASEVADAVGLEPAQDVLPPTEARLRERVGEGPSLVTVTQEYESEGWIRTTTKEADHELDLQLLVEAIDYLPSGPDPLLSAELLAPTETPFPFLVTFDRFPPALIERMSDDGAAARRPSQQRCTCGIAPSVEA